MRAAPVMRYMEAMLDLRAEDRMYRMYVTESLRLQGEGKYLSDSYASMLDPAEDIDADSIVDYVAGMLGEVER